MAFGLGFHGSGWYDVLSGVLALLYIGGFVAAVEYAIMRLHFLSGI
ncbi:hypothetical protein JYK14_00105 [Siccirubricoccus sp. KC 17139]|uniref:Uncharacterized protein n=1 Tax=Siccirubricoccus soli TaxID=2899147 RepID=A0ABT1CY42_9PROT|nr:hypothetical protein [Siccirubricoccus soli]MCO6414583.1 hypothetical protein [Siccirubricoccus soli]MCP2680713.1 hypothetical protein [Siccirubricoccus soli]